MVLPSRKIIYIGVACAISVGVISFAYLYHPGSKQKVPENKVLSDLVPSSSLAVSVETNADTDLDSLKDWEETLWGTDPHNSDTDQDGTSDGDEIKADRNPLIKGPKDTLAASGKVEIVAAAQDQRQPEQNLTPTDQFTRDFFASYMTLKQSGQEITPELEDKIVQSFLIKGRLSAPQSNYYTEENLRINTSDTKDVVRAYGNSMGAILINDAPVIQGGAELAILQDAINKGDPKVLDKLTALQTGYKKMLQDILAVRVPRSAVGVHVDIVNNLSKLITIVDTLKNIFNDPVSGLGALDQYQNVTQETETTFINVAAYFTKNGITYSEQEAGWRFTHANR